MAAVQLDGEMITGWDTFHDACRAAFGFPDFYGRNMDAWIDCLSTLRDGDGMTKFKLATEETLEIRILHSGILRRRLPELLDTIEECVEAVDERYVEKGEKPALVLSLA